MSSAAGEAEKASNTPAQNGNADKSAGASKKEKAPKGEAGKKDEAAADGDDKKISGAELKKQKQAEKAAALKTRLDQAVTDGKLTQAEADAVTKAVENGVIGGGGH